MSRYDCLIFSSGGVKGLAFSGALLELAETKMLDFAKIATYIGVSIGSLYAGMLAIGYTIHEIYLLGFMIDLQNLVTFDLSSVVYKWGASSTIKLVNFVKNLIRIKMKIEAEKVTFAYLKKKLQKDLVVYTTNISENCLQIFSYQNTPEVPIYKAVVMSMSLPPLFEPTSWKNSLHVDGALLCNFPFDELIQRKNSLGLRVLLDDEDFKNKSIKTVQEYVNRILYSTLGRHTNYRYKNLQEKDKKRLIMIKTKGINTLHFNLSNDQKKTLMDQAQKSVKKWSLRT